MLGYGNLLSLTILIRFVLINTQLIIKLLLLCDYFCVCSDGDAEYLYKTIPNEVWPIVYSPKYNISFCGLENLHPFDSKKWGRVYDILESE